MVDRPSAIRVGEVYPGLSYPVRETGEYNYFDGGHELRLFFPAPSADEIEAVKTGEARFAMLAREGIVFLLYRFAGNPGIPWSDAPFSVHLVPEERRQTPPRGGGRALLTVVLADATDGVVKAIRAVTLSEGLTAILHAAIRAQEETGWPGRAEYDRALERVYRKYPRTRDMIGVAGGNSKGGE